MFALAFYLSSRKGSFVINRFETKHQIDIYIYIYKVKQSLYTPRRRLGGEEV
jgi:hypothetical protein